MPVEVQRHHVAPVFHRLAQKHLVPAQVGNNAVIAASRHKAGRKHKHRSVRRHGAVDRASRATALGAVLVHGHETWRKRLHSHKQIVHHHLQLRAEVIREPCYQSHSVKAAERMIAHKKHAAVRRLRQIARPLRLHTHIEVRQYSAAEIGAASRIIMLQKAVQLLLTHKTLKPPHKKRRHKTAAPTETVAQHLLQVDTYGAFVFHA